MSGLGTTGLLDLEPRTQTCVLSECSSAFGQDHDEKHQIENSTENPKNQNHSYTHPTAELPCRNTKHTHAATHTPLHNCPARTQNTLMQLQWIKYEISDDILYCMKCMTFKCKRNTDTIT